MEPLYQAGRQNPLCRSGRVFEVLKFGTDGTRALIEFATGLTHYWLPSSLYSMITSPYRSLVEAAATLAEVDLPDDVDASNIVQVRRLLSDISPSLRSARQWLSERCEVPVEYDSDFFSRHADDILHLRSLARELRMEAEVAAFDQDHATVAATGMDVLQLANAARRGGLIVDLLVGVAISGIGIKCLRKSRHMFDGGTRSGLIAALLSHEHEREPFEDVVERDARWERVTGFDEQSSDVSDFAFIAPENSGLSEDGSRELRGVFGDLSKRPEHERHAMYLAQDHHMVALARMLTVDLALRSWHANEGSYPADLSHLSRALLAAVPPDPFTGTDFIYRALTGGSFVLYSTGPDAVDAGGRFAPWPAICGGGFDLCLDANDL